MKKQLNKPLQNLTTHIEQITTLYGKKRGRGVVVVEYLNAFRCKHCGAFFRLLSEAQAHEMSFTQHSAQNEGSQQG